MFNKARVRILETHPHGYVCRVEGYDTTIIVAVTKKGQYYPYPGSEKIIKGFGLPLLGKARNLFFVVANNKYHSDDTVA